MSETADPDLVSALLDGEQRALARVISKVENRSPGHRDIVSALHQHTGSADVIGVTGSPGSGKSTLVNRVVAEYRDRGETVGVVAVDPSSPFTGGAVLGDRIRLAGSMGDMEVFFRSMSARGSLGGLSTATADAVKAMDAFGKDKIIIETVGAGQNEIDVVRTADTVAVLVPPGSGDDVQMLKAGILEIADVFVVNKADLDGADQTVKDLTEMLGRGGGSGGGHHAGHGGDSQSSGHHAGHGGEGQSSGHSGRGGDQHGTGHANGDAGDAAPGTGAAAGSEGKSPGGDHGDRDEAWTPEILQAVAKSGEGVEAFVGAVDDHLAYLDRSGERAVRERQRYAEEIHTLLRADLRDLLADEIEARGGLEQYVDRVVARETDPYTVADDLLAPVRDCVETPDDRERDAGGVGEKN